jgi:hypothetical protein
MLFYILTINTRYADEISSTNYFFKSHNKAIKYLRDVLKEKVLYLNDDKDAIKEIKQKIGNDDNNTNYYFENNKIKKGLGTDEYIELINYINQDSDFTFECDIDELNTKCLPFND